MEPISNLIASKSDSEIFEALCLLYGHELRTLSRKQLFGVLAAIAADLAPSNFSDVLPPTLTGQVAQLTEPGMLKLAVVIIQQLLTRDIGN